MVAVVGGVVWFATMVGLGHAGFFAPPAGQPPVALGVAAALPPVVVLVLLRTPRWRRWAATRDLRVLTTLQAWRTGGLAFLALAAAGALPLGFALPAGLGDVLVGLTAPLVGALLARGAVTVAAYVAWQVFGVLDLVVAVMLGVLYSDSRAGLLTGDLATGPMSWLPMSIVPTFFVPFLLAVHALALVAVRDRVRTGRDRAPATLRS